MELAVRFLSHALIPYDGKLDVEEYIDDSMIELAKLGNTVGATTLMNRTFGILNDVAGRDALRRFENGNHVGRVGLVGLEGIAVGIAKNLDAILALGDAESKAFVRNRIEGFWQDPATQSFTSPGLRGTVRIQRTVPFGEQWFQP